METRVFFRKNRVAYEAVFFPLLEVVAVKNIKTKAVKVFSDKITVEKLTEGL